MSRAPTRLATEATRGERCEVGGPALLLLDPKLIEIIPGIDPGIVQVVELDADGVIADRFKIDDADLRALRNDDFLARPVALDFGRGAFDTQIFGRQAEVLPIVEFDVDPFFRALQPQFDRPR